MRRGVVFLALAVMGCGSPFEHVRLDAAGSTSPGSPYLCTVGRGCEPSDMQILSAENLKHTAFINLPAECRGTFPQLIVYDAHSKSPSVDVHCMKPQEKDYRCDVIEDGGDGTGPNAIKCQLARPRPYDPATAIKVTLPEKCSGLLNWAVIHDTASPAPTIHLMCAAPEQDKIPTTPPLVPKN
jgi:hypothetical protein